ncbi:D-threo-aldose 1-dehydrogenase [Roseateles sp. YR242]|uniref:aldo/keto reductase n=1 Tax=Roseateles sp. YR242 TaxID=1855305 RepID=UPI0008B82AFE|nr:aldo/keto reductase [Roseateles sp. YR242]SEL85943.1 D-threo-aldose 1-dehydrogenase [Roseateles sp. YR242]
MKVTDVKPIADGHLKLTRFGLGGAALAGLYQAAPAQDALDTLRAAWAAGLRYIDTAPYYGHGLSEHRVGAFLREQPRDSFVISTKVGRLLRPDASVRPMDNGWAAPLPFRPVHDYSYDGVMHSFEDSLQRLGLARIDILFVHDIGRYTHREAHAVHWHALTRGGGFRALEQLREAGRIQGFGLGVNETQVVLDSMQEARLDCTLLAGRYTLLEQHSLALLQACQQQGNAVVVGGPFNSGLLAGNGKFDYSDAPPEVLARADALRETCASFDVPLQAAALQFPLAHPAVVACLSGMRSAAQVRENVAWFERDIPSAMWRALRERGLIDADAPVPGDGAAP